MTLHFSYELCVSKQIGIAVSSISIFLFYFWEEAMPTIIIIVIFLMGKWGCHDVDNLSTLNCIKL